MNEDMQLKLWEHPNARSTRTFKFKELIERKYNVDLNSYEDLRKWSIAHLSSFWGEVWYFTGIRASVPFSRVGCYSQLPLYVSSRWTGVAWSPRKVLRTRNKSLVLPYQWSLCISVVVSTDTRSDTQWTQLQLVFRQAVIQKARAIAKNSCETDHVPVLISAKPFNAIA